MNRTWILEFIRTIAVARIMMPKSYVELSAGKRMNKQMQAMAFMAVLTHLLLR